MTRIMVVWEAIPVLVGVGGYYGKTTPMQPIGVPILHLHNTQDLIIEVKEGERSLIFGLISDFLPFGAERQLVGLDAGRSFCFLFSTLCVCSLLCPFSLFSFFADDLLEYHRSHLEFSFFPCIGAYFFGGSWALLIKFCELCITFFVSLDLRYLSISLCLFSVSISVLTLQPNPPLFFFRYKHSCISSLRLSIA